METALKQRLLGAAVLIALVVIFLPMFFSGSAPEPAVESVSLDIPAPPEGDMQSRVYDVSPDAPVGTELQSAAEHALTTLDLDRLESRAELDVAETDPGAAADPEVEWPAKSESVVRAAAEDGAPGTAAAVQFVVSLGVFVDHENALSQLELAKAQGYPVYAEQMTVDAKPATGVRVGPFPNRVQAESARLKLAGLSEVTPSLVALVGNRGSDIPATAVAADEAGNWAVQLAAYRQRTDALKLRERARDAGFEAFIDEVNVADGHWWRVRIGPRTQRADAESLQKKIKARLDIDGIVVSHP